MVHDLMLFSSAPCCPSLWPTGFGRWPGGHSAGRSAGRMLSVAGHFGDAIFANQFILRDLSCNATLSTVTRMLERAVQVEGYQPGVTPSPLRA
ncbi:MAG: hypothetical protein ACLUI3_05930 [Christensenellales bacterium]